MRWMRILLLLWTVTAVWTVTSCADEAEASLFYQEEERTFTGVCVLEDGSYTVEIELRKDGSRRLTFLEPETLAGCSYLRAADGSYTFAAEGAVFPVAKNPTTETIFGLFALKESDLLFAKVDQNAGVQINVLTFAGDVTVYIDRASGLPLRMEHPLLTLTLRTALP